MLLNFNFNFSSTHPRHILMGLTHSPLSVTYLCNDPYAVNLGPYSPYLHHYWTTDYHILTGLANYIIIKKILEFQKSMNIHQSFSCNSEGSIVSPDMCTFGLLSYGQVTYEVLLEKKS